MLYLIIDFENKEEMRALILKINIANELFMVC